MKLAEPVNPNYAATVVRLHAINILPNCDNVVGAPLFGYQSIISKDHQVGDLGIMFPPEVQLVASYMVGSVRQAVMLLERDPRAPQGERDAAGCLVLAAQAVVFLAFFAFAWIYA